MGWRAGKAYYLATVALVWAVAQIIFGGAVDFEGVDIPENVGEVLDKGRRFSARHRINLAAHFAVGYALDLKQNDVHVAPFCTFSSWSSSSLLSGAPDASISALI